MGVISLLLLPLLVADAEQIRSERTARAATESATELYDKGGQLLQQGERGFGCC
jgi:hypothetical protein